MGEDGDEEIDRREEEEEAGPCAHGKEQDVAGTVHDRAAGAEAGEH